MFFIWLGVKLGLLVLMFWYGDKLILFTALYFCFRCAIHDEIYIYILVPCACIIRHNKQSHRKELMQLASAGVRQYYGDLECICTWVR